MKSALLALSACAVVAACGPSHPAPGEAPGWSEPSAPRASGSAPVPFRDQYLPTSAHNIKQLPPVPEGENVPYAVRGQTQHLPEAESPPPPESGN